MTRSRRLWARTWRLALFGLVAALLLVWGLRAMTRGNPLSSTLVPLVIATAVGLILAPRPGWDEPVALARPLLAAALVSAAAFVAKAHLALEPWWLTQDVFLTELLLALREGSPAAVGVAALLPFPALLPLLIVRSQSHQLEWQLPAGLIAAVALGAPLAGDLPVDAGRTLFPFALALGTLALGSYTADRACLAGGEPYTRERPLRCLVALAGLLVVCPPAAAILSSTRPAFAGALRVAPSPAIERTLQEIQQAQETFRAEHGRWARYLGELGLPDAGAGLLHGYALRYVPGQEAREWSVAADPLGERGRAHYVIDWRGTLRSGHRPFLPDAPGWTPSWR